MKTRRMRYHEQVVSTMKDSFQPPVPANLTLKNQQEQIDEECHAFISSDDYNQQEQIDEEMANKGKQIDEDKECDDFISSDDYSEEVSSESDDAECDDAETDDSETNLGFTSKDVDGKYVGVYACLNKLDFPLADTPQFVPTGEYHVSKIILDDEEETEGSEAECSFKPTVDSWMMSWPLEEEAKTTKSLWVNVHSYYGKGTGCGGYAVILRNMSAQPIASTACFSLDGKSYFSQVLDGLIAGLRLASKHGCSKPYVCCNSKIVVSLLSQIASCSCSCSCKGNSRMKKIGNICQKCANIVPYMSDTRFREFVPRIRDIHSRSLDYSKFNWVSKTMNGAARCLAREVKRKALLNKKEVFQFDQEYRSRRVVDYKVDLIPRKFSDELKSILLNDAYDSIYYNLDERDKIVGSWS